MSNVQCSTNDIIFIIDILKRKKGTLSNEILIRVKYQR